jgi:hypothetical protein
MIPQNKDRKMVQVSRASRPLSFPGVIFIFFKNSWECVLAVLLLLGLGAYCRAQNGQLRLHTAASP